VVGGASYFSRLIVVELITLVTLLVKVVCSHLSETVLEGGVYGIMKRE